MPHKESCTDRGELGIDDGNDFCMNCGEIIKPNEDSVIIQERFLSEKKKKSKSFEEIDKRLKKIRHREFFGIAYNKNSNKRKSFDEIFNERIKDILLKYWMEHKIKIELPNKSGYFYIILKFSYLDFNYLKDFDKDIGKHGWYLVSIIKQTKGFALRCKT